MTDVNVLPGASPPAQDGPRSNRTAVTVHRMDGGLETGESEARALSAAGFPIYTPPDADRPRLIPLTDIKYVVIGSVEDPNLESDPGDKAVARRAILRFREGKDLHKLANDFRDRLALVRDAGLTTGDTLAFSRAVRTYLDRFLAEDGITLTPAEKSALADIILRAAVGYGPLDPLLHDRSVSEIMVNGPDQVFIERRGVLTKSEVRFDDENQLLDTIRRMVATTGRHID